MKKIIFPIVIVPFMLAMFANAAKANCNASFTKSIMGLTVTFTNTSTFSNAAKYLWSFGDGSYSTLKDPIKTYTNAGVKSIQLTVYDSSGTSLLCMHTAIDTAYLVYDSTTCQAKFECHFHVSPRYLLINKSIGSPSSYFLWNFSDSTSSNEKNTSKDFATNGMKIIKLSIFDTAASCSSTYVDTVYVNPCFRATFYAYTNNGLVVGFFNYFDAPDITHDWSFGDGTYSNLPNPVKSYTSAGPKYVRHTMSNLSQTCFDIYDSTIMVPSASPSCQASYNTIVHGLNVNFNNTSINSSGLNNVRFYWDFGDSTGSYNKYPIKTFATGGPKIVTLHLYDSATTCSSFYIDTIWLASAGNNCAASFTHIVNPPFSVSLLSTSTNTNGSAQGLNYLWQFSDSSIANGLSLTKTFTTPGYKWVKLSISDSASGCFAHVVDTFFIPGANSQCASNFTATTNGLTATFNNQSLNTNGTVVGLSYLWSFGDGTNSSLKNPIKTYGSGGPKIVQLSIFDSTQNCFSSKYDSLFLVIPIPVCRASFSMVKDTITPFNFYILNTSLVRSSSTYFWTFGDGSSSTSITPSHSYANFGIYLICLTVSDSICTSTFCDSVGMDSTGILLKGAAFGFKTLDFTTLSGANSLAQIIGSGQTNIYPNPSSGTFNVEVNVNSAAPITFEISDLSGKILLTKTVQAASGKLLEEFDLSNYIPSMYFLSVSSNERIATYKIIKN